MNKILTFAIIVFSFHASAQFNQSVYSRQQLPIFGFDNTHISLTDKELLITGIKATESKHVIQHLKVMDQAVMLLNDSTYYWKWDTISSAWTLNLKSINLYNVNNDLISALTQKWDGTAWVNSFTQLQSFDENNNRISFMFQFWENNSWAKTKAYSFTYDADNKLYTTLEKSWDGSAWVNSVLSSSTYNNNSKLSYILDQAWDGSTWVNSRLSSYMYDANGNLTSFLIQNWDGNKWTNSDLNTYTYDFNNNQTSNLYQKDWYGGSTWENIVLVSYTFDSNNNRTTRLSQSWKNDTWENNYLDSNSYNINNKLASTISKYYNENAWENSGRELYSFDTIKNQSGSIYYFWHNSTWVLLNQSLITYNNSDPLNFNNNMSKTWDITGTKVNSGDSLCYYYHTPLTGTPSLKESEIVVYPNPSNGKFTINKANTSGYIEIYNSTGNRIYSDLEFKTQQKSEIDISDFAEGIYFIKIYNQKNIFTKKVIIQ